MRSEQGVILQGGMAVGKWIIARFSVSPDGAKAQVVDFISLVEEGIDIN